MEEHLRNQDSEQGILTIGVDDSPRRVVGRFLTLSSAGVRFVVAESTLAIVTIDRCRQRIRLSKTGPKAFCGTRNSL
jgi:hypothetical protein